MRLTSYQRLSSERPEGGAARAWAWASLRRAAAAGVARLYAARRRWSCTRRSLVAGRVARPLRAKAAARYEYDSASYARNFDDGAWMAEEGVSWNARSFGACRLAAVQP
ncbi:unnamed protein product [Miscanthus lutarioriparius]|uniref:Uncharacterized protein n=1 Tax=Miscanthus lutarioriparius TaxID=422564 RepID=A0A811NH48_9POAL|nr:unnamed protein product [Miscanthus lutarioriparius]